MKPHCNRKTTGFRYHRNYLKPVIAHCREARHGKIGVFGGKQQVPVDADLLVGHDEQSGDREIYVTISTGGPPFGDVPSIRPFQLEDGDLYGSRLRAILQAELDHGGQNCLKTNASLESQAQTAEFVAYFLEEFAAKFHQKAINLRGRIIE